MTMTTISTVTSITPAMARVAGLCGPPRLEPGPGIDGGKARSADKIGDEMKNQDYGVQFVGYSARVIAWRGNGPKKHYGALDFVSGAASILADDGFVSARNRGELAALVHTLPEKIKAEVLPQEIHLNPDRPNIDKDRFARQITRRFVNIEHVLEQVEEIGCTIRRRPYSEFIDEIAATGCSRVEYHGSALLVGGKLVFHPDYKVATIKPLRDGRTYQLLDLDDSLNPSGHGGSH
jgi:hypothetical protein